MGVDKYASILLIHVCCFNNGKTMTDTLYNIVMLVLHDQKIC